MKPLATLNLNRWIDDHRHLLKPPVGNKLVSRQANSSSWWWAAPTRARTSMSIRPRSSSTSSRATWCCGPCRTGGSRHADPPGRDLAAAAERAAFTAALAGTVGLVIERGAAPANSTACSGTASSATAAVRGILRAHRHRDAVPAGIPALLRQPRGAHLPQLRRVMEPLVDAPGHRGSRSTPPRRAPNDPPAAPADRPRRIGEPRAAGATSTAAAAAFRCAAGAHAALAAPGFSGEVRAAPAATAPASR